MSEGSVEPGEVRHVAELARIDLDEEEVATFAEQFADVVEYFELLDGVPETGDEPDLVNVMREDVTRPSLSQEEALRNAPDTEDGKFKGPRVS